MVLAFERGDDEEKAFWRRCLEDLEQQDGDLDHAMALMRRHGALDDAMAEARGFGAAARAALAAFPYVPFKAALLEAVDFCLDRLY